MVEVKTSPDEIFKCLVESKVSGKMIGIRSPELGKDTYLTAVMDIVLSDEDPLIVIKGYDLSGYFPNKNSLKLKDITSIIPFTSIFENPFLKEMRKERDFYKINQDNENMLQSDYIN